jgi:zona occludens toxin
MDEELVVDWIKEQFYANRHPDCLWIWDEINQFWPVDRQPLSADWAKFVTEHGHLGIDILIMGQDLAELHTTWRRRLQRYTRFTKLDMLGKENSYHWASWASCGRNKFKKTAEGKKPYNSDFFGFYKSHADDTTNKGNYKDGRFKLLQGQHKVIIGLYLVALCFALYMVKGFFTPPVADAADAVPVSAPVVSPAPVLAVSSPVAAVQAVSAFAVPNPAPIDYLDALCGQYQMRLAGVIDRLNPEPGKPAFEFVLEFVDPAYRLKERMSRKEVFALGWSIERTDYGLVLRKEGVEHVARAWPMDNFGKVPNKLQEGLKPAPVAPVLAQSR